MTKAERHFLEELGEIKGWRLMWASDQRSEIRRYTRAGTCQCPLTAVASRLSHKQYPRAAWCGIAADYLGLSRAPGIIRAADGFRDEKTGAKLWRKRLLKACGLTEKR